MSKFITPSGSPIYKKWHYARDEHGVKHLEEVGTRNIQDEIDEYEQDCLVYNIIDKFTKGDTSAIKSTADAMYADVVGMPKNIHEVHKVQAKAMSDFGKLPKEVRDKYDNDPKTFVESVQMKPETLRSYIDEYIASKLQKTAAPAAPVAPSGKIEEKKE